MKNFSILATIALVSGCSAMSDSNIEKNKTEIVLVNQSEKRADLLKIDIQQPIYNLALTVGFSSLPYHATFDACPTTGYYSKLEKVVVKNNKSTPFFKKEKLDCESTVTISDGGYGNLNVEYNIILPYDFNTHSLKGFEGQLPETHIYNTSGSNLFSFGDDKIVQQEKKNINEMTSTRISLFKVNHS